MTTSPHAARPGDVTPEPYYADEQVTVWHGDCRDVLPTLDFDGPVALVVDPPYGIRYRSNSRRRDGNARSIENDVDTSVRDAILDWWAGRGPALVFGSWRVPKPVGTKGVLVWDKGGALGMGDLSLPWKFDHEEVYVLGGPWAGRRDCGSVVRHPPEQSMGRLHPHQKPVGLMSTLLAKVPPDALVVDPCCGVGSTLRAAKDLGRRAVGIELDVGYCDAAVTRMAQAVLGLGATA